MATWGVQPERLHHGHAARQPGWRWSPLEACRIGGGVEQPRRRARGAGSGRLPRQEQTWTWAQHRRPAPATS